MTTPEGPTAEELRLILRVLKEPRIDLFQVVLLAFVSILSIASCLRSMRNLFDLALLFYGIAIFLWVTILILTIRRQSRRVEDALSILDRIKRR